MKLKISVQATEITEDTEKASTQSIFSVLSVAKCFFKMKHIAMKYILSRAIATLFLCIAAQPLFAEPASKIQASYDVIGFDMTLANISETFTRSGDNYQIESVTKAVGLLARFKPETVRIISHGKITAQGLVPLGFSLTREVDTHKNSSAKFNWGKSVITHTDYKGVNDLELANGTQDRLSVLYHLPLLVKTHQTEFKFGITDGNNLKHYSFNLNAAEQNIHVPMGSFKARYISNAPLAEQMQYEIWMASERDYFPYKIIVTDSKGVKLTQVLTDISITP